jgi:hypothetical protein
VVGPDQGPAPPHLSSRSLLQWRREREREREREPGIHFFFRTLHLSVSGKTAEFQGGREFFVDSAYVLIVNVTSMNIIYSLSTNSRL